MGYPLRLRDGSMALLELRPGARLTPEEEDALRDYVEFLRDKSGSVRLAREKLSGPPILPVNTDYMKGSHRSIKPPELVG